MTSKESIWEREVKDVGKDVLYASGRGFRRAGAGIVAAGGGITSRVTDGFIGICDYFAKTGKSWVKTGLVVAVGIGAGYGYMHKYTDRLEPDYNPNQIKSVVERKLDGNDYVVINQKRGLDTEFKKVGKDFKRLEDIREEELRQIDDNYKSERQKIEKKYNGMEERAKALK